MAVGAAVMAVIRTAIRRLNPASDGVVSRGAKEGEGREGRKWREGRREREGG